MRAVIEGYPWEQRSELVPVFDPSSSYKSEDIVAIPQIDKQGLRPDTWRLGEVRTTDAGENPIQGSFQVVRVRVDERIQIFAANLQKAQVLPITFPPDDEDLTWLVNDIVDSYGHDLVEVIKRAIEEERLSGFISGEKVLVGEFSDLCGDEEESYLTEIFVQSSSESLWLNTEQVLVELRKLGCLTDVPDEIACFSLEALLFESGYHDLGDGRWITPDRLDEIDRPVNRRMQVPVIRSKVARELGEDDSVEFEAYEEIELEAEAQAALEEMGEEEITIKPTPDIWQPPATPTPLPTLNYLHVIEEFFPLTKRLAPAFDPREDPSLAQIQIIEGDPLQFLVNRDEGILKALNLDSFRHRFLNAGIPAGTKLWL